MTGKRTESGFSMIELIIAALVMVLALVVILNAFDLNTTISRGQNDLADLQQSMRISAREVARRMRVGGRGGLLSRNAVAVQQNVAASTTVGTDAVVTGTDVLTVRGSLLTPIYRIDATTPGNFVVGTPSADQATLIIDSVSASGFSQPIEALRDLVDAGAVQPEPIILVSRNTDSIYAVVELANITFQDGLPMPVLGPSATVDRATLTLNISPNVGTHTGDYLRLSSGVQPLPPNPGVFPANLTTVLFAGVLEEYRFFVREEYSIPGNNTSRPSPKLSLSRMVPGTENTIHPSPGSAAQDIADNILDLQVALGIDRDDNGRVDETDGGGTPLAANADEWRYNHLGDVDDTVWDDSTLRLLRFNLLGRTDAPEIAKLVSRPIAAIEDHAYSEPATPPSEAAALERRYRRWTLQTIVDMRNL